jgi:hypothetical protein
MVRRLNCAASRPICARNLERNPLAKFSIVRRRSGIQIRDPRQLGVATSRPQNVASELHFRGYRRKKGNRISRTYEMYRKFDPHRPYQISPTIKRASENPPGSPLLQNSATVRELSDFYRATTFCFFSSEAR